MQMMTGGFFSHQPRRALCIARTNTKAAFFTKYDESEDFLLPPCRRRPTTTIPASLQWLRRHSSHETKTRKRKHISKNMAIFQRAHPQSVALCKATRVLCKVVMLPLALHLLLLVSSPSQQLGRGMHSREPTSDTMAAAARRRHQQMALPMINRAKKPHPADAGSRFLSFRCMASAVVVASSMDRLAIT